VVRVAAATALYVAQRFLCAELLDWQLTEMVTSPIAVTLAVAIDQQLANAVRSD
jgi:hypothetical protein